MAYTSDDSISFVIDIQGKPHVNTDIGVGIRASGAGIVAAEIDLHSKYCSILALGSGHDGPSVVLTATDETLYTLDTSCEWTKIRFPELPNWYVFAADIGRYTLRVVLVGHAETALEDSDVHSTPSKKEGRQVPPAEEPDYW